MIGRLIAFFVVLFVITGCKSNIAQRNSNIPPNHCRVTAKVIKINNTLTPQNAKDPCSLAPCMATIEIESVIAYGSAFGGTLNIGDTLNVKFAYTTSKTSEDIIPNSSIELDGVQAGSKILTNIKSSQVLNSTNPGYTIFEYEIL